MGVNLSRDRSFDNATGIVILWEAANKYNFAETDLSL